MELRVGVGEWRSFELECIVGVGELFDGLLIVFEGRPRGRPLLYQEAPWRECRTCRCFSRKERKERRDDSRAEVEMF